AEEDLPRGRFLGSSSALKIVVGQVALLTRSVSTSPYVASHGQTRKMSEIMSTIEVNGPEGKLVATIVGSGTAIPVLFIHADAGTRDHWDAQLQQVAATRRAVALDLRGAGASEVPRDGDQSFIGRAADVGAVLDHLGIDRAVLVGHSGGAVVALTFAVAHPGRVAGLLLIDPAGDPSAFPAEQREAVMRELRGPAYETVSRNY